MKAKIDREIKRLEAKMAELRKSHGILYTLEMHEIDSQIRVLYRMKRDDKK